ncbi:tetratricopeptide repeat protein [Dietzia kunjamensis]|uniref:tetratricopeptide repeat protein n=1 Tax=Dietzia kunjamensis TaxID=322509 RepID=UPI0039BD2E05
MFDSDGFTSAELGHVADALRRGGDLDGAREAYARALALSESAGDDAGAAECREGLGRTALAAGDYDTGLEQLLLAYGH